MPLQSLFFFDYRLDVKALSPVSFKKEWKELANQVTAQMRYPQAS